MRGRKTGGRKLGTLNTATTEARVLAGRIVDDPAYQAALLRRAVAGTLAPALETMLWAYKGRPPEAAKALPEAEAPMTFTLDFGDGWQRHDRPMAGAQRLHDDCPDDNLCSTSTD